MSGWTVRLADRAVATLHVARHGRKGRHQLVFRVDETVCLIEILRVLHDSTDLQRHLDS